MKQENVPSLRISDGKFHSFFGYYDLHAFSGNDEYHLIHRTTFCERLQKTGDVAEIGMIHLESNRYTLLAETTAWNFQQGSMLQWNPAAPNDEIVYNVVLEGECRAAVRNVHTGTVRYLERPIAHINPAGTVALSLNFGRMFDFRPGYGYAGVTDSFAAEWHPSDDGIYAVELHSGKSKLILSLKQVWDFIQPIFQLQPAKLVINHITWNPTGSRFLFLARTLQENNRWTTALLTANADGTHLRCLSKYTVQSHYHWRDADHFVIYGGGDKGNQLYVYSDCSEAEPKVLDDQFFRKDGHCSFSPDRRWLLYDSYPNQEQMRHLYLYDLQKKRGFTLGSYYSIPASIVDIRCDLHPRWNRSGTAISFDSTHEGTREVYWMDLTELLSYS